MYSTGPIIRTVGVKKASRLRSKQECVTGVSSASAELHTSSFLIEKCSTFVPQKKTRLNLLLLGSNDLAENVWFFALKKAPSACFG